MKKKLTSLLLAAALLIGAIPFPASAAELPFTDVPDGKWYTDAVSYVYENGLFGGTSATTFSPDAVMTRAMFVQVLANKTSNYNKEDWVGKSSFTDVPANAWYAPAVEWAYTYGLVNGTSDTEFSPMGELTREQMAVLLYRYAEKTNNDVGDKPGIPIFPDYDEVSNYAKTAIKWASDRDILKGDEYNRVLPKKTAKRCEVAQVFLNGDKYLVLDKIPADEKLTEIASYEDFVGLWDVYYVGKNENRKEEVIRATQKAGYQEVELIKMLAEVDTEVLKKYMATLAQKYFTPDPAFYSTMAINYAVSIYEHKGLIFAEKKPGGSVVEIILYDILYSNQ